MNKAYEKIIANLIKLIDFHEVGEDDWVKPWLKKLGTARNIVSGRPYTGINTYALAGAGMENGYTSIYWMTFNQAKGLGGHVKAGEKATDIIYWSTFKKLVENEDGTSAEVSVPMKPRYYAVFNLEQTEGITPPVIVEPIDAQKIFSDWSDKPRLAHGSERAFYDHVLDYIMMPGREAFESMAAYCKVLFHESIHATGNLKRLNRTFGATFGDAQYAHEELVAELGSCLLGNAAGLDAVLHNSAAYLANWLRKSVHETPDDLFEVAKASQAAADYILTHRVEPAEV